MESVLRKMPQHLDIPKELDKVKKNLTISLNLKIIIHKKYRYENISEIFLNKIKVINMKLEEILAHAQNAVPR